MLPGAEREILRFGDIPQPPVRVGRGLLLCDATPGWAQLEIRSETRAAGAIELAERGDVGTVGADAAGVNRQTQIFGLLDAEAGLVQFGEAVAFRRYQAVTVRQIHGTRRAMRAPPFPYDQEEVVPVSSIPHEILPSCPGAGIGCTPGDFGSMKIRATCASDPGKALPKPRRAAPGTGAVPIITPEVVECRVRTLVVSIRLSADCTRAWRAGPGPRMRQCGDILLRSFAIMSAA